MNSLKGIEFSVTFNLNEIFRWLLLQVQSFVKKTVLNKHVEHYQIIVYIKQSVLKILFYKDYDYISLLRALKPFFISSAAQYLFCIMKAKVCLELVSFF